MTRTATQFTTDLRAIMAVALVVLGLGVAVHALGTGWPHWLGALEVVGELSIAGGIVAMAVSWCRQFRDKLLLTGITLLVDGALLYAACTSLQGGGSL